MKEQIINAIYKALVTGGTTTLIEKDEISVEMPQQTEYGDYSSNIALQAFGIIKAKKLPDSSFVGSRKNPSTISGNNPRDFATNLVEKLKKDKSLKKFVEKIEVAGSGFINFYLSRQTLFDVLLSITTQKDIYGRNDSLKGKKVIVEYTDPNPFKEFHVGHLYSNTVGESIARLVESEGAKVWRADYFGDVGMHVAKAIWGLTTMFKEDGMSMKILGKKDLKERIEYMGKAYARGATVYEEGKEEEKEEMKAINFLVFKAAQEVVLPAFSEKPQVDYDQYIKESKYLYNDIKEIYETGREWSMEYFESVYKRLGMGFDGYYPESRTGEYGYGMVLDGLKKGIFEKGEGGAIIFPGEKYGLHNRVFINSLSLPTYETKDFGNAVAKYKDFPYDKSVIVTGNEINEYFVVVLKALAMYKKELSEATTHIGHGMVRLPEGKMSSRTGKIIRGDWVLDEAKKRVSEIVEKSENLKDASKTQKAEIAEIVAQGAVKYAFLKVAVGNNIAFDFGTSLSFEGNSGPYLQYTFARAQSVLDKVKSKDLRVNNSLKIKNWKLEIEEAAILRSLVHFPEVTKDAAESYSPSVVCNYLYDLGQKYNGFYNKHSILSADNKDIRDFRLILTSATAQIIKNGLLLLGVKCPQRM